MSTGGYLAIATVAAVLWAALVTWLAVREKPLDKQPEPSHTSFNNEGDDAC